MPARTLAATNKEAQQPQYEQHGRHDPQDMEGEAQTSKDYD
jgi:hypothetical protein